MLQINFRIFRLIVIFVYSANFATAFCPSGCECNDLNLTVICDHHGLTSIPILLNPMLKSLEIRNSNGLKMDTFSIALYQELESLELSHNQIGHIPVGFFSQLAKLRRLNLSGNKLKRMDPKIFDKIPNLEILDISSNQLDSIHPETFKKLPNLVSLNLSSNQLHQLPDRLFEGLQNLEVLNLARNRLAKLPGKADGQEGIGIFDGTPKLRELSMAGNIITELNDALNKLHELRVLDLSSNLISIIQPKWWHKLANLRELNLARNLLSTEEMKTHQNSAEEKDGEIEVPIGKSNNIWPRFPPYGKLERVDLSGNAFTQIPSVLFNPTDGAAVKELILEELSQLRAVQENAFANLPQLESLSLANSNFLSSIHPNSFGKNRQKTQNLRHLNLSNCQLSTFALELLSDWKTLETLELSGNRWACDCQLMSFLPEILQAIERKGHPMDNVICVEPEKKGILEIAKNGPSTECAAPPPTAFDATLFLRENFFWFAMAATMLLLFSLIALILCCFCTKFSGGQHRGLLCAKKCCRCPRKGHDDDDGAKKSGSSRVPLYATGSSYTESLIYEKGVPAKIAQQPIDGINHFNLPPLFNCGFPNNAMLMNGGGDGTLRRAQQKSPSTNSSEESQGQHNKINYEFSQNFERNEGGRGHNQMPMPNITNSYSSNTCGDDYYSSIYEGELFHRSPPDSPPPPPPPIFSSPPNWPPPNLILGTMPMPMPNQCHHVAAPPYLLRNHTFLRNDRPSRPPSIHAGGGHAAQQHQITLTRLA